MTDAANTPTPNTTAPQAPAYQTPSPFPPPLPQGPAQQAPQALAPQNQPPAPPPYVQSQSDSYFRQGQYGKDVAEFSACQNMATGYKLLDRQIDGYVQAVGHRVIVVHGAFSMTVEDIIAMIDAVIQQLHEKPVVIVDYLQIVAPTLVNGRIPDSKTAIDHIVHTLKAKQSQDGLTVLAISSLNRQNYLTPVDFESFKESGGIEYTADVIWGLQLSVLNNEDFYYTTTQSGKRCETSLREKRQMITAAKAACPRHVDLVCLKNRYGISSYEIPFEYYPANDYYGPAYKPNDPDTFDDYVL